MLPRSTTLVLLFGVVGCSGDDPVPLTQEGSAIAFAEANRALHALHEEAYLYQGNMGEDIPSALVMDCPDGGTVDMVTELPEPTDDTLLMQHMERYLLTRAKRHGVPRTDAQIESTIKMDAKLNADGLLVWRSRR